MLLPYPQRQHGPDEPLRTITELQYIVGTAECLCMSRWCMLVHLYPEPDCSTPNEGVWVPHRYARQDETTAVVQ
jgi:hypothetical protein